MTRFGQRIVKFMSTKFKMNCDALRDLVPFAQFKTGEKHSWRSNTLLKVSLLHGCCHVFYFVQMPPNHTSFQLLHFKNFKSFIYQR